MDVEPPFRPLRLRDGLPQAFNHIGVIASGVTLARARQRGEP